MTPIRSLSRRPRPAQARNARARPGLGVPRRRGPSEPGVLQVRVLSECRPLGAGALCVPASSPRPASSPQRGAVQATAHREERCEGRLDLGWEATGGVDRAPSGFQLRAGRRRRSARQRRPEHSWGCWCVWSPLPVQ